MKQKTVTITTDKREKEGNDLREAGEPIGMNSNSFNTIPSIAYNDPIRCPATAALEKLNNSSEFFPDSENENNEMDQIMDQCQYKRPQRRVRLLSEGDGDYDPYHSFIVSGIHTGPIIGNAPVEILKLQDHTILAVLELSKFIRLRTKTGVCCD
ncbi:hypothetical protein FRACYDRAFT_247788 [Fragilariopsis cylindrus CCMP1102]|uniref:Uncharacterized protein n=1 Tax=Fragilariopsis cylindrus CCMP1102 TaxID=635003 RepID=A0A1E7EWK0_9STRA|nr:hypothetical protein FRACYDRAFT_247788 [Fragilariopsis cylindrus CCMP1102]|eukprot:OEU10175.1 hypothetical protein FRACYDRAFT_247788 [Fragilariopsis cylindrus CCMP1102]